MRAVSLFLLILNFNVSASGQLARPNLEDYLRRNDTISFLYPSEKVYLQLDKSFYASGQTIWFKSYVTTGANQPSMISKILYVDLIDGKANILQSVRIPLSAGLGWGSLSVPGTLTGSEFRIRAYTNWMRNFGEESFFDRRILVLTRPESPGETVAGSTTDSQREKISLNPPSEEVSVRFFPEGGQLVEGVRSRVGFKALAANGLGAELKGYIRDSTGIRVAEFSTENAGMGSFMLTPFGGQKYEAVLERPRGEQVVQLPSAIGGGYVLTVTGSGDDNLMVRVTASSDISADGHEVYLAIIGSNQESLISPIKMTRHFADVLLRKSDFGTGIAQLTLFNHDKLPVAERLVFLDNYDQLDLQVSTDKPGYGARQQVKMQLKALDASSKPTLGSFSVSVTSMGDPGLFQDNENTILSGLLLKSELRGNIERPGYYFEGDRKDKLKARHLDNLLLTQGWRRIDWKQQMPEMNYKAEKAIVISGQMLRNSSPVAAGKVTLFAPGGGVPLDTLTDAQGRFSFSGLAFADSTRFVIQGRTEKDRSNITLRLDPVSRPAVSPHQRHDEYARELIRAVGSAPKILEEELDEMARQGLISRQNVLQEVVVKATREVKPIRSSKLGNSPADYTFTADQLSGVDIADALVGKVLGMEVNKSYDSPTIVSSDPQKHKVIAGLRRNKLLSGIPAMRLFVDGIDVGDDLL